MKLENSNSFLYFAYGANVNEAHMKGLEERLNGKAQPLGIYLLHGYNLTTTSKFENHRIYCGITKQPKILNGQFSTIIPKEQEHVIGYLWRIDITIKAQLDKQEGVNCGLYDVVEMHKSQIKQIGYKNYIPFLADKILNLNINNLTFAKKEPLIVYQSKGNDNNSSEVSKDYSIKMIGNFIDCISKHHIDPKYLALICKHFNHRSLTFSPNL